MITGAMIDHLHDIAFLKVFFSFFFRVRSMACQCLVLIAPNLSLEGNALLSHAKLKSSELFSHLNSTSIELSFAGIADTLVKESVSSPMGLSLILWFIYGSLRYVRSTSCLFIFINIHFSSSTNLTLQMGCLEALHLLCLHYPPPCVPSQWKCSTPPFTPIQILFDLLNSSRLAWSVQGTY